MDNPYQSPAVGNRGATRLRVGRVLLAAAGLALLIPWPHLRPRGA